MSRGLTYWNDDTINLIKENFIAVSVPTWVCRTRSPEGEFLRSAGVHKQWVTSSGYKTCLSASGKMLGRSPSAQVLEAFRKLPEPERKPGAIKVPDLKPSERVVPAPPKDGLVLRVHARFLSEGNESELRPATPGDFPLMQNKPNVQKSWALFLQPNTEYAWMTQKEWQGMVPKDPKPGQTVIVADAVAQRLARFHLTPKRATTSEGGIVNPRSVKSAWIKLHVSTVSQKQIRMTLKGYVHWGSDFDADKATTPNGPLGSGFETQLYGRLEYDRAKQAFTRFDVLAPGYVWGRWGDANGKSLYVERPGRKPFGFALELATGNSPSDRIPPGGNGRYVTERTGYFPKSR